MMRMTYSAPVAAASRCRMVTMWDPPPPAPVEPVGATFRHVVSRPHGARRPVPSRPATPAGGLADLELEQLQPGIVGLHVIDAGVLGDEGDGDRLSGRRRLLDVDTVHVHLVGGVG